MSKQRVIVEAVLAGQSQRVVAARYGVSQPRVSQLMAAWRAGGWEALEPKSRRPHSNPRATSAAMRELIIGWRTDLVAQGLDAGPATIAAMLSRHGHTSPAASTIHTILTQAGLITPAPRKRPRSSYLRFAADLPNECWQADFTHWALADGSDTNILLWVDDHSRYLLRATAHRVVSGTTVVTEFRHACAEHGKPASTLTDNGMVFTTRHVGGPNGFELELASIGVEQKNGHPNHPQTQGKVERLNQTLKRWLKARPRPASIDELQHQLNEFADHYNHQRPHRALAGATPAQAYNARAKATPNHNRTHWRIRDDKVHPTGSITLRLGGRLHHIGMGREHTGRHIRMLIHDLDITIIDPSTGEILRELTLDPDRDYQPLGRKPGPPKGSPRQGGRQPGTPNKQPKKIKKWDCCRFT